MKLQPDRADGIHLIDSFDGKLVRIGGVSWDRPLVLESRTGAAAWAVADFEALTDQSFAALVAAKPELVIFGSGTRLRFPKPLWIRPLIDRGIGIESMTTDAACRTYNILASEGRHVLAALLL